MASIEDIDACTDKEADAAIGDVIETPNGNRYLVGTRGHFYIGNRDETRADWNESVPMRPNGRCKIIGKVSW